MGSYHKKLLLFLTAVLLLPHFLFPQDDWEKSVERRARKLDADFYYVGLQQIADILNTNTYYSDKARKAILYLGSHKLTVTAFNPFVMIGKQIIQMPVESKFYDGDIFVPVKFFIPLVRRILSSNGAGDFSNGADIADYGVNITGVQVEAKANGTLIRVNTRRDFEQTNISTRYSRKWLYLDVFGGHVDPASFQIQNETKHVRKIVAEQSGQTAHIAFLLRKDMADAEFNFIQNGSAIWVSIPSDNRSDILSNLETEKDKWRIDKIVIDPGHGGKDPGTIGARGTYEKNVVLPIGLKLRDLIKNRMKDVEVFMTRDTDEYISLEERTHYANKVEGKLFISIHANWNRNKRVDGASTYFLGLAKSDEALEIAQRENAVIKYDDHSDHAELTDDKIILATMAQNAFNKESQDFAAIIQENISETASIRNRGVKQAGFYVLVGASMPNVLVETAFMSNSDEERKLRSSSFQQRIAEALYESVEEFRKRYELSFK